MPDFKLWRQDDNGNSFLIGTFAEQEAAEQRLAQLADKPHKQIYWIEHGEAAAAANLVQNLFLDIPIDLPDELTEVLCRTETLRVERIISRGHKSPENFWYNQENRELVLLIKGRAGLEFAGHTNTVSLQPGDWLIIDAHVKHRVSWTAPEQETIWLAIHF